MDILYPAFAMFALTLFVQVRLGLARRAAVRDRRIDPRFFSAYRGYDEPDDLRVLSRHLDNLYEAPVLFYAILVIAQVSGQAGLLPVLLAWAYVALRFAHSAVHLGANVVMQRFRIFLASLFVLTALWLVVLVGMLIA